jgi:hypothetical protein
MTDRKPDAANPHHDEADLFSDFAWNATIYFQAAIDLPFSLRSQLP